MATRDDYEIELIRAQIAALNAETAKNLREMRFPPVVLAAVVIGVVAPSYRCRGHPERERGAVGQA